MEASRLGAASKLGEEESADATSPGREESQRDDENGAPIGDEGEGGASGRVVDVEAGGGGVADEEEEGREKKDAEEAPTNGIGVIEETTTAKAKENDAVVQGVAAGEKAEVARENK